MKYLLYSNCLLLTYCDPLKTKGQSCASSEFISHSVCINELAYMTL